MPTDLRAPAARPARSLRLTAAQEQLFRENLWLVAVVVARLSRGNRYVRLLGAADAEQVGAVALARAVQGFDPGRAGLRTFASLLITRALLREATRQFGPGGCK